MLVSGIPLLLTILVAGVFIASLGSRLFIRPGHHLGLQRVGVFTGLGIILLAFISLPLLPWLFRAPTSDQQLPFLAEIPEDERGPYLQTAQGFLSIPSHDTPFTDPPEGTPSLSSEMLDAVLIVRKQLSDPSAYQLFNLETGALLSWNHGERGPQGLLLKPALLAAGAYMLVLPGDGMYGSPTYHYFVIS